MHYDKQTDSVIIPLSDIESFERELIPVDPKNGWECNLPGKLTIVTKSKQEQNELDTRPGPLGKVKD